MNMKYMVNRSVIDQVNLESASLTSKTTIVHRVNEAGNYAGQVSKDNRIVGHFKLSVRDDAPNTAVNMNLADLDTFSGGPGPATTSFVVATKGYCVFSVASGTGGYVVTLFKPEKGDAKPYSTRELADGDVFAVTILRPGVYTAVNTRTKASAEITIPYPKRTESRLAVKPVSIECTQKGMNPDKVETLAGAGIVFYVKTDANISLSLKKPIEAPTTFKSPDEIPRSVERKVLAVLNSSSSVEFLSGHMDTGKGKDRNRGLAEKIIDSKRSSGRIGSLKHVIELEKLGPDELSKMVDSLREAHGKLLDRNRFAKQKK